MADEVDGKKMGMQEFKGYMVRAVQDIDTDIKDIKKDNKEQWKAIGRVGIWNKIGTTIALIAAGLAGYLGFGGK